MRYQTIDRCTEPGCRCLDAAGVILYDGPDHAAAVEALRLARYPDPQVIADCPDCGMVPDDACRC